MERIVRARSNRHRDTHRLAMWWIRLALVLSLATCLVAGCTGPGKAAASSPMFPAQTLAPADGALLGAWEPPSTDWSVEGQQAAVERIESQMGHALAIDHHYYKFTVPFPSWREPWDVDHGRIPLISWARTSDADVIAGVHDDLIRQRADAVRALGSPVFIRWSWEMDSPAVRGTVGTPEQYVSAWRHIHELFAAEGATNVRWVWCPNAWAFDLGSGADYYPGDDVVDWICADSYNWSPLRPGGATGGRWNRFSELYDSFYDWAAPHGKPIMVGETGAQEGQPGQKAQWIAAMGDDIEHLFPAIKALVYFDAVGGSFSGGSFDWRVDTSEPSRQAFLELAADPYFQGRAADPPDEPEPLAAPTGLRATTSGTSVNLAWVPTAGTATTVYRNGMAVARAVGGSNYSDPSRRAGRTYKYSLAAVDTSGRASERTAPTAVTVPYALRDGFESGSLAGWRRVGAVAARRGPARAGAFAARATSAGAPAWATHPVPRLAAGIEFGLDFRVDSQGAGSVLLQTIRTSSGRAVLGTKRRGDGRLALYDYGTGQGAIAPGCVSMRSWHHLQLVVRLEGGATMVEVFLDGHEVPRLTGTHPLSTAPVGGVQVGDDRTGRMFDVLFDDVLVRTPAATTV